MFVCFSMRSCTAPNNFLIYKIFLARTILTQTSLLEVFGYTIGHCTIITINEKGLLSLEFDKNRNEKQLLSIEFDKNRNEKQLLSLKL